MEHVKKVNKGRWRKKTFDGKSKKNKCYEKNTTKKVSLLVKNKPAKQKINEINTTKEKNN